MASVTFAELPEEDALSTHSILNLVKFISNYRDGRRASSKSQPWDEPARKYAAPRRFLEALLDVFYYTDDHHLRIKNNILGWLKDSSIKGMGLVKQVEKSQNLLRGGRLRGESLELYNALDKFLDDGTIKASNRLEPTGYDDTDLQLGLVPRICSHEALLICARLQGTKWCVRKYLTRELLLIEKDLRQTVLEVLTAGLLKNRHPKYPILLKRTKAIQSKMQNAVKDWERRLEVAVSMAKSKLAGVSKAGAGEVEIMLDTKAAPGPEWFVAFNAGFNEYERTLKTSGILNGTK